MRRPLFTIFACIGCGIGTASAQNSPLPDPQGPVAPEKKNDVSVVLDDLVPSTTPPPIQPSIPTEDKPAPAPAGEAVLVTGRPPAPPQAENEPAPKPDTGVVVRVEKLQTPNQKIDPAQVSLAAPFPAKPLSEPPPGWKVDVHADAKPFLREVEIAQGTKISLSIRPHVLIPVADGSNTFNVNEPGFEPERQYQQVGTIGAILTNSVESLDNQARQLGDAIDRIQQLLVSLPPSDPPPASLPPKAEPVKKK